METSRKKKRSRRAGLAILLLLILAALLLLIPWRCATDAPFDYFRHRAEELDRDPGRVIAWVRDDVGTLDYRGDLKGALGALWNGAGSPEEKLLLARALLLHCEGDAEVSLETVAPGAAGTATDRAYEVTVLHRRWTGPALASAETKETELFSGPVGSLVGDVHSIEVPEAGVTRVTFRVAGEPVLRSVSTAGSLGEEIVFRVEHPGDGSPREVVRELWRADNAVGAREARPGDRHDLVVLPCRVTAFVREKEKVVLEQRGRAVAPEARGYEGLLEYAAGADEVLADLEKALGVVARFDRPRILLLSTFGADEKEPAHAIDLRLNHTSFAGEAVDARLACQVRSLLESGMEHVFLSRWTGVATGSAFETFGRLRDDTPARFDRRIEAVYDALHALREHGGPGASATFAARRPGGDSPTVRVEVEDGAFRLRGGPVRAECAEALASGEVAPRPGYVDGMLDALFSDAAEAAVVVEATLLAADGAPAIASDYWLESTIDMGRETMVRPSARFELAWGEGAGRVTQSIQVRENEGGLEYAYHTRRGLRTASGRLAVAAPAVAGARRHNPHYRNGTHEQEGATSFCVSRAVRAELAAGRAVPFALEGAYGEMDDPTGPRPTAWEGRLEPAGTERVVVPTNGKPVEVTILRARLVGGEPPFPEVAILDDPQWPVGRADCLVAIRTSVRGRLLDEQGRGIGGAHVQAGDGEGAPSAITWPDGRFRLPPSREEPGEVLLVVTQKLGNEEVVEKRNVDLTAPGLDEVTVTVPRARVPVAWIAPGEEARLEALPVSAQVKRHARRDLASRRVVAIPEKPLPGAGVDLVAYYAYDPATGEAVGVTEDGLHGATVNWGSFRRAAVKTVEAGVQGAGDIGPSAPLHAMRGANTAMFMFATYRLQGYSHAETIERLLDEMESWEERTNMFTGIESVAGGKAREKLAGKMGKGTLGTIDGDSAKASFYLGYIVATAYLAGTLE
jgi:hypothetical protein